MWKTAFFAGSLKVRWEAVSWAAATSPLKLIQLLCVISKRKTENENSFVLLWFILC